MEKRSRKSYSSLEKSEAVKRHIMNKEEVSLICDDLGIAPSLFYRWQKELFDNAAAAFEVKSRRTGKKSATNKLELKINELESCLNHKDTVIAQIAEECVILKKAWPKLKSSWIEFDIRDQVVDFIKDFHELTDISTTCLLKWLGLASSKFYDWINRYGMANEHNGKIPRDWWLEEWEKEAIKNFYIKHPDEGYRRLTYMMLDEDIVACAPSTTYRVLKGYGLLDKRTVKPSKKGTGFNQPDKPHEHWHIDITYLNLSGTFYYMCSVLDGFSRYIVNWEISESMKEPDIEMIIQKALEEFKGVTPRIISDNGPQFIAKDFKDFVRLSGMTHVRTSPYYPQSNGKQERMQGTVKKECIRERNPATIEEARRFVAEYVKHYNEKRLHSAIGYISPLDMLKGKAEEIQKAREIKLNEARQKRKENRSKCVA